MLSLVEIRSLKKHFPLRTPFFSKKIKVVHAVDGVDLRIEDKDFLGLVGESGCGKTTLGRLVLGLMHPTEGNVYFQGQDIFEFKKSQVHEFRKQVSIIFQDPFASLNPRKTAKKIISQPFEVQTALTKEEIDERTIQLLEAVGISPASRYLDRYPHEFSGGQRQRIGIARAIALRPKFIVADEPVSSLDVSVRAQILNLMKTLQNDFGLTYLFITHDLSVVRSMSNKVAVMYLGKIVEFSEVEELYSNPIHPYTQSILSSIPIPNPRKTQTRVRKILKGEVPDPINPPLGCRFHTRCPITEKKCSEQEPKLKDIGKKHFVACFLKT